MISDVRCAEDLRREQLRTAASDKLNGIDYVEIDPANPRRLVIVLVRKIGKLAGLKPDQVRITAEDDRSRRAVHAIAVEPCPKSDPQRDDCIAVVLDCEPDGGPYRVCLVAGGSGDEHRDPERPHPALDQLLSCGAFRGDAGGRLDRDCLVAAVCEQKPRQMPAIDYLARDYSSIRRSILDRLALTMPDWDERHIPDVGMTVVEAMAYVADRFAYTQDAIGTEAYLPTARRRVSVRRHVRLVDHRLHEGTNARAWVVVETDQLVDRAADEIYFTTTPPGRETSTSILRHQDLASVGAETYEVFEPATSTPSSRLIFRPALSSIPIYTWSQRECCLPIGATQATLVLDEGAGDLRAGSVVLFEEVLGPATGAPADADPTHRHAVRLVEDPRVVRDPLNPKLQLVEITWGPEDALPFDLCLSTTTPPPDCRSLSDVSLARGNVVLVDHGRLMPHEIIGRAPRSDEPTDCVTGVCPPDEVSEAAPIRPILERRPIVFAEPAATTGPASAAIGQDPEQALPAIIVGGFRYLDGEPAEDPEAGARDQVGRVLEPLVSLVRRLAVSPLEDESPIVGDADLKDWSGEVLVRHLPLSLQREAPDVPPSARLRELERSLRRIVRSWAPRIDLLDSGPQDADLQVECDEDGQATIRFGDGELGASPEPGEVLFARYRIGGGPEGNVGAETIRHLVLRNGALDGVHLRIRNPLPAAGGLPRETLDHAKRQAPNAPGRLRERAITAGDYAELAHRDFPRDVQGATAALDWTGSWFEASVSLDQRGRDRATDTLCDAVETRLERYRRMGHDLAVGPAVAIPIAIRLRVCVAPHALRGHVGALLDELFGVGRLRDGSLALFHPDALEAGAPVRASRLVAAALRVDGVLTATVQTLERAGREPAGEVEAGILEVGPREIVRVEPGGVSFVLEGGR